MPTPPKPVYVIPTSAPEALRPYVDLITDIDPKGADVEAARLGMLLVWLADDVQEHVDDDLAKFDISEKKLDVLLLLALAEREEHGESLLSPSAIAEYVGVTRTTVTGLLDFLEKRKLVRRMNHPDDRRRIQTVLTPTGRALVNRATPTFWRSCASMTEPLDDSDKKALERILGKLYTHLKSAATARRAVTIRGGSTRR